MMDPSPAMSAMSTIHGRRSAGVGLASAMPGSRQPVAENVLFTVDDRGICGKTVLQFDNRHADGAARQRPSLTPVGDLYDR